MANHGYELAWLCARNGFDLVVAADEPEIDRAADDFRMLGAQVASLIVDLSTTDGVDRLYDLAAAQGGRSTRCAPMRAGAWARLSWTRISGACAG